MPGSGSRLAIVLGTRPEIIKFAPLIHEAKRRELEFVLIHTGQHYSENLDDVFFRQLDLPTPDHALDIGSGAHSEQTGEMIVEVERVLLDEEPEAVFVQGDTNSTLAGGIAASKLDTELAHVEAGLRSFDRGMPEEINRILVDHAADYLFPPTEEAAELLEREGIPRDRIVVTGNTVVDSVQRHRRLARERSTVLENLDLRPDGFVLLTAHRAENVDDPERFADLLDGVARFAGRHGFDVVYPIHPRAQANLDEFGLEVPDPIRTVEPLDFLDFLRLETEAAVAFTDSGGVQEETCVLGTPCVTVRDNTERPETVEVGANVVAGLDPDSVVDAGERMLEVASDWSNPFGDGRAAERIVETVFPEATVSTGEATR